MHGSFPSVTMPHCTIPRYTRYVQKCMLMRFMNCMMDITRCPVTLILTKNTHNSVKHEVIWIDRCFIRTKLQPGGLNYIVLWKRQKGLFYMKYANSGIGAFLDISEVHPRHFFAGFFFSTPLVYHAWDPNWRACLQATVNPWVSSDPHPLLPGQIATGKFFPSPDHTTGLCLGGYPEGGGIN